MAAGRSRYSIQGVDQFLNRYTASVGAAEGCDLLIFKNKEQKIAAFGSSYTGNVVAGRSAAGHAAC
jgi:hypothetical protein